MSLRTAGPATASSQHKSRHPAPYHQGRNAKGTQTSENFLEPNKCSQKIFQKISQISLLLDFKVFLDIFEIFTEDCFLLRSSRKFLPSGFLPLKPFPETFAFNSRPLRVKG